MHDETNIHHSLAETGREISNDISRLSDAQLLNRIWEDNDRRAYKFLIDRYLKPLWRLATNILNDQAEAEDVIQEVFMGLWQKKLDWDEKGSAQFTTWLYRAVLNKCIDIKRKRVSRKTTTVEIPAIIKDSRPHSEEILQNKQKRHRVKDALSELPDTQRRAMHLFYYEDWKIEDIARHMGTSIDSVKALLKRGRQAVKGSLTAAGSL